MVTSSVVGLFSLFITFAKQPQKGKIAISVSFIISLILLVVGNSFFATPYSILVALFSYFSLACLLLSCKVKRIIAYFLAFIFPIIVCYKVLIQDSSEIFAIASINFIPIYFTLFSLPYFITCYNEKKEPSIIPLLLCLISCLLTHGRGNIIFSFLTMLLFVINKYNNKIINSSKKIKLTMFVGFLSSLLLFFVLVYSYFPNLSEEYLYRFAENSSGGIEEEARVIFLLGYIDEIFGSLSKFIFGSDYRHFLPNEIEHLHNSYLMIHHFTGMFGFILLIRYLVKGCVSIWKDGKFLLLVLFIPFSIKCFTEWAFPLVLGDVFIWYVILYPYLKPEI